jgi:uncharacterized OB-fold protein
MDSSLRTSAPDNSTIEVPIDQWTQGFWDAAAEERLVLPRCVACGHFRWPPGPFCPRCHDQGVVWVLPGEGRVYSFTLLRPMTEDGRPLVHAPALIEFPEAGGVRIVAPIVDTPVAAIRIGAPVVLRWTSAATVMLPLFTII